MGKSAVKRIRKKWTRMRSERDRKGKKMEDHGKMEKYWRIRRKSNDKEFSEIEIRRRLEGEEKWVNSLNKEDKHGRENAGK
jgi:hypothetical protein